MPPSSRTASCSGATPPCGDEPPRCSTRTLHACASAAHAATDALGLLRRTSPTRVGTACAAASRQRAPSL
eukprot:1175586-Prymnesium_polylepis.1